VRAGRRLVSALPYLAVLAAAVCLLYLAGQIDYVAPRGRVGPDFWPRAVLWFLVLVCVYETAKRILFAGAAEVEGVQQALLRAAGEVEGKKRGHGWRLAAGVAATLAYVLLVDVLGFFLSTFAFIAAFIVIGGQAGLRAPLMSGAIGSLVFVTVFMKIVYVSLPLGQGPFRAVSVGLMSVLGVR
jgi:putative tricarboxylic transport membrane protein